MPKRAMMPGLPRSSRRTTASPAGTCISFITAVSSCLSSRQVDAGGPAEAGGHRLVGLLDDPRPLRRVGEALQHRLAAAVLGPAGNRERYQAGLPGQVRIDVGGGVVAAFGRLPHLGQDGLGAALLVALHLHVGDDGGEAGAGAHGDGLGHRGYRAEPRFRRQAVVVGEGGAPFACHPDHRDHVFGRGEVRRLVVEPGRHAPGAGGETGGDQLAHPRRLRSRRPAIGQADHLGPHAVEPDVGAEVHRQAARRRAVELRRQVERSAAIGVHDLGRHPLGQHVGGGDEALRRGVAVDVDETGCDEQASGVDVDVGSRVRQAADPDNRSAGDRHVGLVARRSGTVDDGAVTDDHVVAIGRGLRRGSGRRRRQHDGDGPPPQ